MMKKISFEAFATAETKVDFDQLTINGVQILRRGEAKGHGLFIDEVTVSQVVELANKRGKVPASLNHYSGAEAFIGYFSNFTGNGEIARADLNLFESSPFKSYVLELASRMPEGLGFSIVFYMGEPEIREGKPYARVNSLEGCDLVKTPAATTGIFEAKTFDTDKKVMITHYDASKPAEAVEKDAVEIPEVEQKELSAEWNLIIEKLNSIELILASLLAKEETEEVEESPAEEVKETPAPAPAMSAKPAVEAEKAVEALEVGVADESPIEKFNKLKGAERTKFWKQNRPALLPFLNKK